MDKPVEQMNEEEAKQALKAALEKNELQELKLGNANQSIADEKQKFTNLEQRLQQEKEKAEKADQTVKFLKENPTIHAGKIEGIFQDPAIVNATTKKIEAETENLKAQRAWPAKASHAADQVLWPIIKDQGSFTATELRKKVYLTTAESQNEKIGKLKLQAEKKSLSLVDLDIAMKLIALDQNTITQEASENLNAAQELGQTLANLHALSQQVDSDESEAVDLLIKEALEIQKIQLKNLRAKTFAPKAASSERTIYANKLIQDLIEKKHRKNKE